VKLPLGRLEYGVSGTVFSGSADAYDRFMGRYSRQLAVPFSDLAGVDAGMRVLDIGAGTGALTGELVARVGEPLVAAAEPSPDYCASLRARYPDLEIQQAPAEELPWPDDSFDAALAQLVVTFMTDAPRAMRETARVLRPGGTAAVCMWQVEGMDMMNALREVRRQIQPGAEDVIPVDFRTEQSLRALLEGAGLVDVETTTIAVSVTYSSVDELWEPSTRVGGPGGPAAKRFSAEQLERGRALFAQALGSPGGMFTLGGRAAAARGTRA
jgi:ubiquinone/menaquinone biosynthesis C-methylase UbiE